MPLSEEEAIQILGGDGQKEMPMASTPATDEAIADPTVLDTPTESTPRIFSEEEARAMFGGSLVTGGLDPSSTVGQPSFGLPEDIQRRQAQSLAASERQRSGIELDLSRPGVELDYFSGVKDSWLRARMNLLPDPLSKLQFLSGQLESQGINPVDHPPRFSGGRFILPQKDEDTGEIKDFIIDEPGFTKEDLADIGNEAIPLLLGMVGERKMAARGVTSVFKRLLGGGAGVAAGRFGQTVVGRATGGVEQNPMRDTQAALVEAGMDVLSGLGLSKLLNLGNAAIAPNRFITRTPEFQSYNASMQRLEDALGVPIRVSPGELLLDENLLVFENFARTQFGGEILREVQQNASKLRAKLGLELSKFPNKGAVSLDDLDPGAPILREMWDKVSAKQTAFSEAKEDVIQAAASQFVDESSKVTTTQSLGGASVVGKALRNTLEASRVSFRNLNEVNYGEADRLLRRATAALGDPLAADQLVKFDGVSEILSKFAAPSKVKKVVPGEFKKDPLTGRLIPVTQETVEEKKISKLLPDPYKQWSDAFRDMSDGVSIQTANQVRRALADEIASSGGFGKSALGSRELALLNELRDSVTKSMDKAYGQLPDGAAKDALLKANAFYSNNVKKFQTPTIKQLFDFTPEGQVRMPDDEILGRVSRNSTAWRELRNFVGTGDLWDKTKRGVLDDILYQASVEGIPKVGEIYRQLKSLPKEVRQDILGSSEGDMLKFLRSVSDLKLDKPKARVPYEVVKDWIAAPSSKTRDAVLNAVNAQTLLDQEFKSAFKRKSLQKFQSPELLDSKETVGRLIDLATTKEAEWAVNTLGKGPLREKLVQQTFEELFRRANMTGKLNMASTDIQFSNKNFINASSFRDQLLGTKRDVYRILLGDESFQLASDYLNYLSRGDYAKELAGASVGTLSRGSFINNLWQKLGDNTYRYAKWKIMSTLLAAEPTRKWMLGRGFERMESENVLPAIMASSAMASRFSFFLGKEAEAEVGLAFDAYMKSLESVAPNALTAPPEDEETPIEQEPAQQ